MQHIFRVVTSIIDDETLYNWIFPKETEGFSKEMYQVIDRYTDYNQFPLVKQVL